MKYRKKPVVIDAIQWTGKNHREMFDFLTNGNCPDEYMTSDFPIVSDNFYIDNWKVPGGLVIKTLEGEHLANIGDYIIRGVHGEFYPCKPDIFRKTYEEVTDCTIEKSNMRLIDANLLKEAINNSLNTGKETFPPELIYECIDNQPTAYDVERVIKELDEKSIMVATSKEFYNDPQNGKYVANVVELRDAIKIVKGGGVE